MKMELSFTCKIKSEGCSFNRLFLNVIYHLDNTAMPYDPFCSLDMRAEVSMHNTIFNRFFKTQATGQHRSLQINYVFSTKADIIGHERW